MSDLTVSHPSAFLKPDELGDFRADIARHLIKQSLLAEAVSVSGPKLSKYLNGKIRLPRALGDSIRAAIDSLRGEAAS